MLEQLWLHADLSSEGNQGRTEGCWGGGILNTRNPDSQERRNGREGRAPMFWGAEVARGMLATDLC